jgi:hypothetical protein
MMFFFPPSVDSKHWNILLATKHWIILKNIKQWNIETFYWPPNIGLFSKALNIETF